MNNEMIEAARLTREGRLAEATALISLAMGSAPVGGRARFVDVPPIDVTSSSSAGETTAPEPPPAIGAETGEKPPAQPETGRWGTLHQVPAPVFAPLDLTSLAGLPMPDILSKLPARGPSRRQFPAEVVAPAAGQWTAGA